jgi:hypothetical protein
MSDIYRFRVKGHIASQWDDWFSGLSIMCDDNGDTVLSGMVQDQAALYGILVKLHNLNLPLIAVLRVDRDIEGDRHTEVSPWVGRDEQ